MEINDYAIIENINKVAQARATKELAEPHLDIQNIDYNQYQQASYNGKKDMILDHLLYTGKPINKDFSELINGLEDFEELLYATKKFYRDHVFHTFRVWGLGLYLYHNGLNKYMDKEKRYHFHFNWYLASVYHDVGYPIEGLNKIIGKLNGYFRGLYIGDVLNIESIDLSLNNESSNRFIDLFSEDRQEIDRPLNDQRHGLISARLLLYMLDYHLGSSWSLEALPALKAIGEHDGSNLISFSRDPISALLIICDELQEWGRPYISPIIGDEYSTTDHIDLDLRCDGDTPSITAKFDYKKSQKLTKIIGWDGDMAKESKIVNLKGRLSGINVDPIVEF